MENGVYQVVTEGNSIAKVHTIEEYVRDYSRMLEIINNGPCKSFSYIRLKGSNYLPLTSHRF